MKAIIFDFDGTLADSFKVVLEIAHSLTNRNQLVEPNEIIRMRKMRMINVARELQIPKWLWPTLIIRGRSMMGRRIAEIQPFPGIAETLEAIHKDGYQMFIMTSNSQRNVDLFLATHGMSSFFSKVYGGIGLLGKARALRKILRDNHLQTTEAIYVGDEPRDIEGAKLVDMPCVAVAWGYNDPDLLAEHAPMVVVRSAQQLLRVLEQWGSAL